MAATKVVGRLETMTSAPQPILLYDGDCGLCNRLMRFMLKHDRRGVLLFAPLQGRTGQALLRHHGLPLENFDSLVFVSGYDAGESERAGVGARLSMNATETYSLRTTGALRAFAELGGGYRRFAGVAGLVPAWLRDALYRLIAKTRYRVFGRYQPTPLPDPAWARRILD